MAHINLLPWRIEQRQEQQKQLLSITLLSVILMGLIIVAIHLEISRQIGSQNSRNQYLQSQISVVQKQLTEISTLGKKKQNLTKRMKIIEDLQANRAEVVHLFDEVARRIPEGIHLTRFKQNEKQLTIHGVAQSNARISAFMRNIAASNWLGEPRLEVIKADKNSKQGADNAREFVMYAKQIHKKATKAANNKPQVQR